MMDNSDKKTTRGGKGDYAYIDVQYWPETVICHPELENQCPWDKIEPSGWHDILLVHPEFIRHAPKKITVSFMNIVQWLDVLLRHPELGEYFPDKKTLVNQSTGAVGANWGELLARHPEFARLNPWKFLRRQDWALLLRQQPQFIGHYETDRTNTTRDYSLIPGEIVSILTFHPELFSHFAQEKLSDRDWRNLLFARPEFCDKYSFDKIDASTLGEILARYPKWLPQCDMTLRSPDEILHIAETFPEVMKHYDLKRFREIGDKDSPWIEVYPQLLPYTSWKFSYNYWDLLLTRISQWMNAEKFQEPTAFIARINRQTKPYKLKYGGTIYSDCPPEERPPLEQPDRDTLRNSLDSIMELRYQTEQRGSRHWDDSLQPYIREMINDTTLTYEQLMIRLSMMPEEGQKQTILGFFSAGKIKMVNRLMEAAPDMLINVIFPNVLLPWMLMYAGSAALLKYIKTIGCEQLAAFRDAGDNNALHYAFFRCPWYSNIQADEQERLVFQELQAAGVNPEAPNKMGFSYRQVCKGLENYLLRR